VREAIDLAIDILAAIILWQVHPRVSLCTDVVLTPESWTPSCCGVDHCGS
jgi:hypothetical protein